MTEGRAGRWQETERACRELLETQPGHPEANHTVGMLAVRDGRPTAGLLYLKAALETAPETERYWLGYIEGLLRSGRLELALLTLSQGQRFGLRGETVDGLREHALREQRMVARMIELYHEGKYPEVARLALEMTGRWPASGVGWKWLGQALLMQGRMEEAVVPLQNAVEGLPEEPEIQFLLGLAWHGSGHFVAAEDCYRRVLERVPEQTDARYHLGLLLAGRKRLAEAEETYRALLSTAPDHLMGLNNLGVLLQEMHRFEEAEVVLRIALGTHPDHADTHNHLGNLLFARRRFQAAEAAYRQALALHPDHVDACNNLGVALAAMQRYAESEACYRQALRLRPDHADAHNNLGNLLVALHRHPEGEVAYRQALRIRPEYAEAWNNLGNFLKEVRRFTEAEEAYRQALAIRPDYADALNNLGVLLQSWQRYVEAEEVFRQALRIQPDHGYFLGQALQCAQSVCRWQRLREDGEGIRRALAGGGALQPFTMLMLTDDGMRLRQVSAAHVATQVGWLLDTPPMVEPWHHPQRERLRIGYLSANFRNHPITQLLAAVIEAHDRERFVVYGYSYGLDVQDEGRRRIVNACDHFRNLTGVPDRDSARMIADDGIDILLELSAFIQDFRPEITAFRPAPILVNFGYPGTMGHERMADYKITDGIVTPIEALAHFSETMAFLPHCIQPNDRREILPPPTRSAAGLPEEGFVFCCFNQSVKFNPESLEVWCRLLLAIPGSVLWLSRLNPVAITNLRGVVGARGIDPDRLVFAPRTPTLEAHLGRLALADLALDTFPFNSHTTASDLLWAGVPLITRMGTTFVSRVAASLLHALGLPELVTRSWDDYYVLALRLARNPDILRALRKRLWDNRLTHPLFDTQVFVEGVERIFERMWQDHGQGKREMIVLGVNESHEFAHGG
ncbi:MAG: tetratricopeptide repeat protein [Magnetococcales bacterium]|nr:tetratricopeptide repeat protein [Magnetococcales bacterium]